LEHGTTKEKECWKVSRKDGMMIEDFSKNGRVNLLSLEEMTNVMIFYHAGFCFEWHSTCSTPDGSCPRAIIESMISLNLIFCAEVANAILCQYNMAVNYCQL
jgi:hypothetical protein